MRWAQVEHDLPVATWLMAEESKITIVLWPKEPGTSVKPKEDGFELYLDKKLRDLLGVDGPRSLAPASSASSDMRYPRSGARSIMCD